ncbi:hypothetical protein CHS0354_015683 [Potamilus streckersoni]|uniref:Uncharacterized protein n=1 Tax=Potamilus streckersoni TaxID=2493646 RepID=A0AAE0SRC8_9BIVA|nr:hypothetical protein CHS0354_015683 [Potamilus streckersoni]
MNGTSYFVRKWEYATKLRPNITQKLEAKLNVSTEYNIKHETNQDTDQRSFNMAYIGEKKMKSNNSTKYGRNDFIGRKHKDINDSEHNVVSNDRGSVTDSPIIPNEPSSPKKDEDQNYGYCSEKVNATRSAGKRKKEPEVTIKSRRLEIKVENGKGKFLEVLGINMMLMMLEFFMLRLKQGLFLTSQ